MEKQNDQKEQSETSATCVASPPLSDLLPCQCGGMAVATRMESQDKTHYWWAMMCSECHAGPEGSYYTRSKAEREWQRWVAR